MEGLCSDSHYMKYLCNKSELYVIHITYKGDFVHKTSRLDAAIMVATQASVHDMPSV
ncbi:hypothetical protein GCM10022405_42680 [Gibbsiella dentisursi]|uniref:Uncharacterized protein n=1 Tax=Gibbsiella dentisursi TaxID=796890 RepID=A0ABP7M1T7_9GAMM